MRLPQEATVVSSDHLRLLDAELPGLVSGLYMTGSVALGDYQRGSSDLDYVAVISRPIRADEHDVLGAAHRRLAKGSSVDNDGVYIESSRLAAPPVDGEAAPHTLAGNYFGAEPCFQLSPVTWLELREHGIPIRGTAPHALVPSLDRRLLRRWLLGNLNGYWLGLADERGRAHDGMHPQSIVDTNSIVWATLGPGRLHYTLTTGRIASKTAAGHYVAGLFPRWKGLVERCVSARAGHPVSFSRADSRECEALIRCIVSDAASRGCERPGAPPRHPIP